MTVASTPELESDRQALIALIGDEAVFHGDFTLSSGKKATYYVDMRKLTSTTARRRRSAGSCSMWSVTSTSMRSGADARCRPDRQRGPACVGARRHAGGCLRRARSRRITAAVARSRCRGRGQARRDRRGHVDDGRSPLKAAQVVKDAGADVVAVVTVVDRKTGAQAAEAAGFEWRSIIDLDDLGLAAQ
jgi:orotate phosphoribosyltransferase